MKILIPLLCASVALGATTQYADRASFLQGLSSPVTIGFNGIAAADSEMTYGSTGVTLSGVNFTGRSSLYGMPYPDTRIASASLAEGYYGIRGSDTLTAGFTDASYSGSLTITLPAGTTAVGFDLMGPHNFASQPFSITLSTGETFLADAPAANPKFVGFRSTSPIASITIQPRLPGLDPNSNEVILDNFTFASTSGAGGGGGSCIATLAPEAISAPAAGVAAVVQVSTAPGCARQASSTVSWIQVSPLDASGPGNVAVTVFPNFTPQPRTATVQIAGRAIAVSQAANPASEDQRFVQLLYFSYFGRLPSNAEIAFQLSSGLSRDRLALNFLNSGEFNIGGRFIAGLYVGLLDRDAEFGGWLFQRNALATGAMTQTALVANFLNSGEYRSRFGTPSDDDFVRLLYRHVLLRDASAAEVAYQSARLAGSPASRVQLALGFLNSPEFRQGVDARLLSFLLYATLLQRDVTPAERVNRSSELRSGVPLLTLVQSILTGGEFITSLR